MLGNTDKARLWFQARDCAGGGVVLHADYTYLYASASISIVIDSTIPWLVSLITRVVLVSQAAPCRKNDGAAYGLEYAARGY